MAGQKRRGEAPSTPTAEIAPTAQNAKAPQPSRWQLVTSSILVGLWIFFLAWMAFTS